MQTLADVLNMPIEVVESEQACALGTAILASVAGGVHKDVLEAQNTMKSKIEKKYLPNEKEVKLLANKYRKYLGLAEKIENNK